MFSLSVCIYWGGEKIKSDPYNRYPIRAGRLVVFDDAQNGNILSVMFL